jgi:BlaI family penicillinase repressor
MAQLKLTGLQYQIMDLFWDRGGLSVREVHTALPSPRPAYTTVQTLIGRLEIKGALKRTRKIGNAYLFEALVSRSTAQHRMIDELVALFGGRSLPIVTHLIDSGKLTPEEVREARKALRNSTRKDKGK